MDTKAVKRSYKGVHKTMKQYRTPEQFNEIMESMENGNWTQAGEECVKYGFYANDLLLYARDQDFDTEHAMDLVELIEIATEKRYKK